MDEALVQRIRERMEWEAAREAPPSGFPAFPDIPGSRYTDPGFFELERAHLWTRSWLYAGREEEVAEPGSFKLLNRLGIPVLLVRGADKRLRAFYNTCQHRGAPVVREPCGVAEKLRCQFHSWTYSLEGELIGVPDERDFVGLDRSGRSLVGLRCESWDGWIFVNADDAAPPLLEWLYPIPEEMAQFQGEGLRIVEHQTLTVPCNWKVASDAFLEVYHVNTVHPQSIARLLDHRSAAISLLPNGHSRMVLPKFKQALFQEQMLAKMMGKAKPDIPTVNELVRTTNVSYHIFPNIMTSLEPFGFPFIVFWPIDTRTTEIELVWFGPDWGEGDRPKFWEFLLPHFNGAIEEDTRNVEPIQRSLESPGLRGIPLNYQERRIYHHHEQIDRMIGRDHMAAGAALEPLLDDYVER